MLRNLLLFVLSGLFVACEPDCEDCDTGEDEELTPLQEILIEATSEGTVVRVVETSDSFDIENANNVGSFDGANLMSSPFFATAEFGLYGAIGTWESALATCPALGLPSPEYDWFCVEENQNGRVVAKDDAEPDIDSFQVYDEYPSVEYPDPMTSRLFFSQTIYPNHWGGPYQAMRGIVTAWGAGWGNARVARCNSPVWASYCNQE